MKIPIEIESDINRKHQMEQVTKEFLTKLKSDVQLVTPKLREWWLNVLNTHSEHIVTLLTLTEDYQVNKKILEVGSVPGFFTVLLKQLKYDITGVDIKPERTEGLWKKYGVIVHEVDIEREVLPFDCGLFDVVFFAEILEHLRVNPLLALHEVYRVLKPNGKIIVSVPNITPIHRIKFLIGRDYQSDIINEFEKLDWLGHMGHFRLYSISEVKNILKYLGFQVQSILRRGKLPGGWWRFVHLLGPFRDNFRSHVYIVATKVTDEHGFYELKKSAPKR